MPTAPLAPQPPPVLTGRDSELAALEAAIHQQQRAILCLRGMGGIGKSALAATLAQHLALFYPDGSLVIPLQGSRPERLSPSAALATLLQTLYPDEKFGEDLLGLRQRYQSALQGKRMILLLDDAYDLAQVEPFFPPPGSLLLITTRQGFALIGAYSLTLDLLARPDSVALLRSVLDERLSAVEYDHLARLCGDLPLALEIAAGALFTRPDQLPAAFLSRLNVEAKRLRHLKSVAASLRLSYKLLDPAQQARFRTLGIFPADFDLPAAAAVWGGEADSPTIQDSMSALVTASLVRWDPKKRRYKLHDLVRLFAEGEMSDQEYHSTAHRHGHYFRGVLQEADRRYRQGNQGVLEGLRLFDRERVNIEAGQRWAATHAPTVARAANLCRLYPSDAWYILNLRLHPRDHIAWLNEALTYTQQLHDRKLEGTYLGHLGIAYLHLGEAERSLPFHYQRLQIGRELGDQRMVGLALANLGIAFLELGEVAKARDCHERHLAIARRSGDRRGEGMALGNLGRVCQIEQKIPQAITYHQRHWKIADEIGDMYGQATALRNLAAVRLHQGERARAVALYERARDLSQEYGDWRGEGHALGQLGMIHHQRGEWQQAIDCYERRLRLAPKTGDRRAEANTLNNVGALYRKLGEPQRALIAHMQALALAREIGEAGSKATALWGLALAQDLRGQRADAIAQAEAALATYEALGNESEAKKVRRQLAAWRAAPPT